MLQPRKWIPFAPKQSMLQALFTHDVCYEKKVKVGQYLGSGHTILLKTCYSLQLLNRTVLSNHWPNIPVAQLQLLYERNTAKNVQWSWREPLLRAQRSVSFFTDIMWSNRTWEPCEFASKFPKCSSPMMVFSLKFVVGCLYKQKAQPNGSECYIIQQPE